MSADTRLRPHSPATLPDRLVDAYLARLRQPRPAEPTLEALHALTRAHIERVTYEYLDIPMGVPPSSLDPRHTASRVAYQQRGGWCFQLCGAFASLLTTLGFRVTMHRATVRHSPDDNGAGAPVAHSPAALAQLNHLAVCVHLKEGRFLADVGLGDYAHGALKLEAGEAIAQPFKYAVEETEFGFRLQHDPINGRGFAYFDMVMDPPVTMAAFEEAHHRLSTARDSPFVGPVALIRRTADTVYLLKRCTLTEISGATADDVTVAETVLDSEQQWWRCMREVFHIHIPDGAARAALFQRCYADHLAHSRTGGSAGQRASLPLSLSLPRCVAVFLVCVRLSLSFSVYLSVFVPLCLCLCLSC